jgi:hypothetical protein
MRGKVSMDKKLRKQQFIEAYISNGISENPITNKELATNLNISEQHFYRLRLKFIDEINERIEKLYSILNVDNLRAIRKALKDNPNVDLFKFVAQITGRFKESIPGESKPSQEVIINVGPMEQKEIEKRLDEKLQKIRAKNLGKSKS